MERKSVRSWPVTFLLRPYDQFDWNQVLEFRKKRYDSSVTLIHFYYLGAVPPKSILKDRLFVNNVCCRRHFRLHADWCAGGHWYASSLIVLHFVLAEFELFAEYGGNGMTWALKLFFWSTMLKGIYMGKDMFLPNRFDKTLMSLCNDKLITESRCGVFSGDD